MGSFSVIHWIILGAIGYVVYSIFRSNAGSGNATFCTTCGTEGSGKSNTKGSILIEIVLWCAFIVPGLIYSLWRLTTRAKVCAACGAATLVPTNSPIAQKMKKDLSAS